MDDNLDGKKSVNNFMLLFLVTKPICRLLYIHIMYSFRCQSLHQQTKVYGITPRDLYPPFNITHTAVYVGNWPKHSEISGHLENVVLQFWSFLESVNDMLKNTSLHLFWD